MISAQLVLSYKPPESNEILPEPIIIFSDGKDHRNNKSVRPYISPRLKGRGKTAREAVTRLFNNSGFTGHFGTEISFTAHLEIADQKIMTAVRKEFRRNRNVVEGFVSFCVRTRGRHFGVYTKE